MKQRNAAFKKFIRHTKHDLKLLGKYINNSNNDRKRRHEPMMSICYWKCKYYELTGKRW